MGEIDLRLGLFSGKTQRMILRGLVGLLLALLAFCGSGCEKSAPKSNSTRENASPTGDISNSIVRLHWIGKKRIAEDTNAAELIAIWNLPESVRLETQTVEKLSTAPWRLLLGQSGTNAGSLLLRPLIRDLVEEECYLEISETKNQSRDFVLAVRHADSIATSWETNLATVIESLTRIRPIKRTNGTFGWTLKKHDVPNLVELSRTGGWTLIGVAEETNKLQTAIRNRIERSGVPFLSESGINWVEGYLNVARLIPSNVISSVVSSLDFSMTGEAGNVRSKGSIATGGITIGELEPWMIPTNIVDGSFGSFTALRGIRPLLENSKFWNPVTLGPSPNQAWIWALQGMLMQTYLAAPLSQGSNQMHQLSETVMRLAEKHLPDRDIAGFQRSQAFNGLEWRGFPFMSPFIRSMAEGENEFLLAGFFPFTQPAQTLPPELTQMMATRTNLVMYDWELTGPRIEQWIYMSQFCRVVCQKAQLPADSAGLKWLQALVPRLGNSATELVQAGPDQFSFSRKSTAGFTAIELNLLADWLESPAFPKGLHTLLASPSQP